MSVFTPYDFIMDTESRGFMAGAVCSFGLLQAAEASTSVTINDMCGKCFKACSCCLFKPPLGKPPFVECHAYVYEERVFGQQVVA